MSTTEHSRSPSYSARAHAGRRAAQLRKVVAAAREAFAEGGAATSLEEIARRAGVGIGTLYRHFPNRQALLEAVYVEEVEALCRSARRARRASSRGTRSSAGCSDSSATWPPSRRWRAELLDYIDRDAPLFTGCRSAMYAAGEPLLERAQEAGVVRAGREPAGRDPDGRRDREDPHQRSGADRAHPRDRARRPARALTRG